MKKLLSIILVAFLILPLNILNFTASADAVYGEYENFSYFIENNQVTITGYNFTNNNPVELIIPSAIDGCPVTSIGQRAIAYRNNIVSIYIPESVINMNGSFYFCSSIESITVEQNNTKYHTTNNCLIETDKKTLILGCKNSILPTDGSVTQIGPSAFVNCKGLKTISIPNTIRTIGCYAFSDCENLSSIFIPESVTDIDFGAFSHCDKLKSIEVDANNKDYHSSGNCIIRTKYKTLVAGCNNSIIPDDGSVTKIGEYAFGGCKFTDFAIPNGIKEIGNYVFNACYSLERVSIPESVTIISNGAFRLTNIKRIILPKSIEEIGYRIFADNTRIKDIYYVGSELDRENILINSDNDELLSAKWHYNACPMNTHSYDNSSDTTCNVCGWIRLPEIDSLQIDDVSIMEGSGYKDENGHYIYNNIYPSFTVTLKDGRKFSSNGDGVNIDDEWYSLSINTDNQRGENWTAGNTYQTTGSILGVSDTFNVTIKETPVESLEIQDVSVIEYTHGYDDGNGNYIYSDLNPSFTVNLKDGGKLSSNGGGIEIDGEWYSLSIDTSNQATEYWTVGNTYEATGNLMGVSCTFNVKIIESPVESLTVNDVICTEGTRGRYIYGENGGYYYDYAAPCLDFSITLKDGTKLESSWYDEPGGMGNHGVLIDGELYDIDSSKIIDNQDNGYWGIGTHTATAEFLGVTDNFNVIITETPVESIDIEDVNLIKGVDSYDNGSYVHYNINPTYTLTFKDGSQKTINNGGSVSFDGYYSYLDFDINQYENPLEVGNTYELTGRFGCLTDKFKVTVIDNPVTDIEIINPPQKTEYIVGERFDLKGATLCVHFNDNTYEDINIKYSCDGLLNYGYKYYSDHLQNSYGIDFNNTFTEAGRQKVAITFLGKTVQYEVNVKENLWKKIEIKNGADKSLIITAFNPDGTTLDMKVLDTYYFSGYKGYRNGCIMTDKGIFVGTFYLDDGNAWIKLNGLTSNTLTDCEWMNLNFQMYYSNVTIYNILELSFQKPSRFNRKITAENIDSLIFLASGYIDVSENRVSGQTIREALLKTFAVKEIDLSLSKNYDPQSDTYIWNAGICYPDTRISPTEIKYNNGAWNIKITKSDETVIYLKLDDELKIISINYGFIPEIPEAPNAPTLESKTHNSVTLKMVSGCEYSMDGENWQSSNVFNNLKPETEYTFYQRLAETDTSYASDKSGALKVKTEPKESLINEKGVWYYIVNGSKVNATTLVYYYGTWYYVENGKINWNCNTLCRYGNTWYYVQGGQVNWSATTLCKYGNTWYYVQNGEVNWNATTLCKYGNTWYYVQNGEVNWSATTLCKYGNTWYYVQNGQVNWSATTLCKYGNIWYYVQNGEVNWGATTLCKYGNTWYYVQGGQVNWGATTLCKYGNTWYYVQNGQVNFNANLRFNYYGTYYNILNGVVKF